MNTLKLNEHSFSSVNQFCKSVLISPNLKVRLLAQCLDNQKIPMTVLVNKIKTVFLANEIDSVTVSHGASLEPASKVIFEILKSIDVKVIFVVPTSNYKIGMLPSGSSAKFFYRAE